MPIFPEYKELLESRKVVWNETGAEIVRVYSVLSANPEHLSVYGGLPAYGDPHPEFPLLYCKNVEILPPTEDGTWCRVRVTYGSADALYTIARENWSWELSSAQTQITSVPNSSYQVHYGEDLGTVIGMTDDSVEGVSVYRPQLTLVVEKVFPEITIDDRLFLESMVSMTNGYPWFEYERGEVLFLGASIERRNNAEISVKHNFSIVRWKGPQAIEDYAGNLHWINPFPHDYVWYRYADSENGTGTDIVRGVRSVHVAQVYDEADFTAFGFVGPFG